MAPWLKPRRNVRRGSVPKRRGASSSQTTRSARLRFASATSGSTRPPVRISHASLYRRPAPMGMPRASARKTEQPGGEAREHVHHGLEVVVAAVDVGERERLRLRDHRLRDHVEPLALRRGRRRQPEAREILDQVAANLVAHLPRHRAEGRARVKHLLRVEAKEARAIDPRLERRAERLAHRLDPRSGDDPLAGGAQAGAERADLLFGECPDEVVLVAEVDVERFADNIIGQMAATETVAVVGAGFSGIGMGVLLKRAGIESFTILEKAADVGGTWRENTYPGAACDVPSHLYSFSFEPKPDWSRAFSPQQEIWDYLRHCVAKYDLARHIRFGARVTGAAFDPRAGVWTVRIEGREPMTARALVLGNGALHVPSPPDIPGLGDFRGRCFHSAEWD